MVDPVGFGRLTSGTQKGTFGPMDVMTDADRVAALRANGHDAHLLPNGRIVLRLNGQWFRVAGGDFRHPSLLQVSKSESEALDRGQKPGCPTRGRFGSTVIACQLAEGHEGFCRNLRGEAITVRVLSPEERALTARLV